jgi:anti-sigma B factor antagonist
MPIESTLEKSDHYNLLTLRGKLMSESELEHIKQLVQESDKLNETNWILDLSELLHMNSTGINFMVKLLTRARVNNRELVLSGVKGSVANLFKIAKIDLIFTIFNTPSEAKEFFTSKA